MKKYFSEMKVTLWIATPFIINQVLQMSVVTIDSLMAGWDSELTLAAVSQGTVLWHFVMLGIIGLLMPISALAARAEASGDNEQLQQLFQQVVWVAIPLGALGFLAMWYTPMVLYWVGVDEQIIPPATEYLRIVAFTIPLITLFLPVRYVTEGVGNPTAMMILTATSIPINVIGNYCLLNGVWIFPKMGIAGIATATVIAELYFVIAGWWYIAKHKRMRTFALLSNFSRPMCAPMKQVICLGIPSALALLMEEGMFTIVILLSGKLGVSVAAANQIAFNYISNAFMIPLGISMALATRIGAEIGQSNIRNARTIGLSGIGLGAISMVLSVIGIIFFGEVIASFYTDDAEVISLAVSLLALAGIFQIFDGVQVCGGGALRGLEETKAPMRYAAIGYWLLGVPMAVLLAFPLGWGAEGLWTGLVFGLCVTAVFSTRKFAKLTSGGMRGRHKITLTDLSV